MAKRTLTRLARGASEAGAGWFGAGVLFLMPASREQFLPFLQKKFPKLARRYQEFYGGGRAYPPEEYRREIARRVDAAEEEIQSGASASRMWRAKVAPPQQQLTMAGRHELIGAPMCLGLFVFQPCVRLNSRMKSTSACTASSVTAL